jgi:RNA polymerase sigma-B factor
MPPGQPTATQPRDATRVRGAVARGGFPRPRPVTPVRPSRRLHGRSPTPMRYVAGSPEPAASARPSANGSTRSPRRKRVSSRQTVRELVREYRATGDPLARERLIEQYMPLVKSLARRHSKRGEQYEDLVQVGSIGLIKAVDRFDPDRGVELGAFAIPNIAGEIKRYIRDRAWPLKIPRRLQELHPGLSSCSAELSAQLERPATIAEIAQRSGVKEPEVEAALAVSRIQSPVSLSRSSTAQDAADDFAEIDGVLDGGYELGEQRAVLAAGFRVLNARERRLLHLRFFAGLSQPQIAQEVGISRIHVSRLTRQALEKMRTQIGPIQGGASPSASSAR